MPILTLFISVKIALRYSLGSILEPQCSKHDVIPVNELCFGLANINY